MRNKSFIAVHSIGAIENEIFCAEGLLEEVGTAYPDDSFEDGYAAALRWMMGKEPSSVEEEYRSILDGKLLAVINEGE
ncbi:hypothetical protein C9J12_08200 [Photobacterium frigidiphilum]|uniref:Uncharacterized protein n=1 Tax=Photobacterium frigidiphilum TaxID=264736 RepID=A0A2T3JKC3_9GAMM|nr:hypothetical protein [Photobacterium frigidiphilum]PSU49461.1 hypothetical protein C9J12_08200 [Photobacterium frigidiphilum]